MLHNDDRRAIEALFDRLALAERRAPERDQEAQELIDREIGRQPGAPYYMAQTILVQQHALEVAERRIEELERSGAGRSPFGGLFDDGRGRQNRYDEAPRQQQGQGPWDRPMDSPRGHYQQGGGGFLAGAAQTAVGVAGGVLLGSAIGSLLGAGGAHAADGGGHDGSHDHHGQADDHGQSGDQDAGQDDGGWGDFGGGDGGFDIGGDF